MRIRERIGLAQLRSRRVLLELPQALPLKRREVIRCLLDVIDALNQQGAVLGLLPLLVAPRDLCVHAMIRWPSHRETKHFLKIAAAASDSGGPFEE